MAEKREICYAVAMAKMHETEAKPVRCFLVGKPRADLRELRGLVQTLGMETVFMLALPRLEVLPAYGMGKGKAEEIAQLAKEYEADCIVFDFPLEPTKQRNWEKLSGLPTFDREEVILRIFAARAATREARLQVELARLQYSLPRLAHMYGDMARQRGGNYGARGAGETQLELDQRQVHEKISRVQHNLQKVADDRKTRRKRREKYALPLCALVGYTNAGKSSLLNALTGSDVAVEDKLFATLDPTTRRLRLGEKKTVLLTDTVGFISELPHTLIDAFKSTLEETSLADLLLITLDASDENVMEQYETVCLVLSEIEAEKNPRLILFNKIDKVEVSDDDRTVALSTAFPDALFVSAKTGAGFAELFQRIESKLFNKLNNSEKINNNKIGGTKKIDNINNVEKISGIEEIDKIEKINGDEDINKIEKTDDIEKIDATEKINKIERE